MKVFWLLVLVLVLASTGWLVARSRVGTERAALENARATSGVALTPAPIPATTAPGQSPSQAESTPASPPPPSTPKPVSPTSAPTPTTVPDVASASTPTLQAESVTVPPASPPSSSSVAPESNNAVSSEQAKSEVTPPASEVPVKAQPSPATPAEPAVTAPSSTPTPAVSTPAPAGSAVVAPPAAPGEHAATPAAPTTYAPSTKPPAPHTLVKNDDGSIRVDDRFTIPGDGTPGNPYQITWDLLVSAAEEYSPRDGRTELPQRVKMFDGQHVEISGNIAFPLMVEEPRELLSMLNQWDGCCIGVPPTPYDAIEVKLTKVVRGPERLTSYGIVRGKLKVEPQLVGKWLVALYAMDEATLTPKGYGGFTP